jgi:hypothetical protein
MTKQFDNIRRTYEFRESDFPRIEKPFLFWTRRVITGDKSELIRATARQRVDVTQSILKTLEEALGRKVEMAGIQGKDLPVVLAFSEMDLRRDNYIDFGLVDDKKASIGSLGYSLPHWKSGIYSGRYLVNGGIDLHVLGSAIRDETQYNALQIGLRKVQSA